MTYGLSVALSGAAGFAALLWINLRIARSWLYPGVALAGIWTVVFVLLCVGQGWLYPVPWVALGVYFVGAWSFTVGAYVGIGGMKPVRMHIGQVGNVPPPRVSDFWLLVVILLVLLIGFPFYLRYTTALTTATPFSPEFFLEVRAALVRQAATQGRAPFIANLVVLANIGAILAFAVTGGGRRWRVLVLTTFVLAAAYNVLTASKAGLINLLVAVFAVVGVSQGRFPIRVFATVIILILFVFGLITVLRVEGASGHELSIAQAVDLTSSEFVNYLVAGTVAFGVYLENPSWVQTVWSPWQFFERTANYFGNFFHLLDQNAQYVSVGRGLNYNVYTAYFAYYPHYGFFGVVVLMLFLGIVAGHVYRKAVAGGLLWISFYSAIFYGVILTVFNESLLTNLNYIFKLLAVAGLFLLLRRVWSDPADRARKMAKGMGVARSHSRGAG